MKIDRNKKDIGSYHSLGKTGVHEVKRRAESSFDQELDYRKEEAANFKMQEMLDELDRISARLSKSLTINDLMLYKKMVKNFLKEASAQAYQLNLRRGRNRSGRTIMITVNTIDTEVDQLIREFMENKREAVEILEVLDKIRGMLVDLLI